MFNLNLKRVGKLPYYEFNLKNQSYKAFKRNNILEIFYNPLVFDYKERMSYKVSIQENKDQKPINYLGQITTDKTGNIILYQRDDIELIKIKLYPA